MQKIFEKVRAGLRLVRDYYRARVPARLGFIGTPIAGLMGPLSAWALTRIVGFGLLGIGAMVFVHRHNERIRTEVHGLRDERERKAIETVKAKHAVIERALQERIGILTKTAETDATASERASGAPFRSRYPVVWPAASVKRANKR